MRCGLVSSQCLVSSHIICNAVVCCGCLHTASSHVMLSQLRPSDTMRCSCVSCHVVQYDCLVSCHVRWCVISSPLVSSRLVSSRLVSSHLISFHGSVVWSRPISSHLISSGLIPSHLISSRFLPCAMRPDVSVSSPFVQSWHTAHRPDPVKHDTIRLHHEHGSGVSSLSHRVSWCVLRFVQ